MLTRTQVARRLGKSLATVRRLEGAQLHPHVDANGVHRFEVREVELLARRLDAPRARPDGVSMGFDPGPRWLRQPVALDEGADELEVHPTASRCGSHLEEIARLQEQVRALEQALAQQKSNAESEAAGELSARSRLRRELLELRASASDRQIRRIGPELLEAVVEFLE
ncbi:MAG: hypothetical protein ABI895_35760 [Deltaproteobacteria bacterium]